MFTSQEEEARALKKLNDSIQLFNDNYGVSADIVVFEGATNKKSANRIFIDTFKNLLKQAIQSQVPNKKLRIVSMRDAFERDVVEPYRRFSIQKAAENEVGQIQEKLPDVNAGLNTDELWGQLDKTLDDIYYEKIDLVVNDYKNGSPRIRDMLRETKTILGEQGEISHDNVKKIASYAAALKRVNESRSGPWRFFHYFRNKAEKREASNIAKLLNERMGDPNAYQNALKEMTDPTGKIERLKEEARANRGVKLILSDTSKEKRKADKVEKPKIKEEKVQLSIEDEEPPQIIKEEEKIPGNERLYKLLDNKSFELNLKDEIWKTLKLKETMSLDKKSVVEQIYKPLLANAKNINEDYMKLENEGKDVEEIGEKLEDSAKLMFTEAYLNLENFRLDPKDRVVAAQKITDLMLNQLTVIGFKKDQFGKYGENCGVEKEDDVLELLQFGSHPLSEEAGRYVLNAAKKELNAVKKEKVVFPTENTSQKEDKVYSRQEEQLSRDTFLRK
jgi:hypothetical protein